MESFERIKELVLEYWPTILEYALMIVVYFLVFLYKKNFSSTKNTLISSFKEQIAHIDQVDETLRNDMKARLEEAQTKYINAVNEIEDLMIRLRQAEAALNILIEDAEVENNDGEN